MKRVENAVVDDRPDVALRLARDIPPDQRPTSDNRNRHLIDVSAAHVELRRYDAAFDVLAALSRDARPWLVEQRSVRDLLGRIISTRRTLTPEMRELADLVQLEYRMGRPVLADNGMGYRAGAQVDAAVGVRAAMGEPRLRGRLGRTGRGVQGRGLLVC
ncbi:hypothetical protein ACW9HJ_05030 [Nocardia gipuzkoensis]